jgi:hypothetical protein
MKKKLILGMALGLAVAAAPVAQAMTLEDRVGELEAMQSLNIGTLAECCLLATITLVLNRTQLIRHPFTVQQQLLLHQFLQLQLQVLQCLEL